MLEAAGGGGTPWDTMSVEEMHQTIQGVDLDGYNQVLDGWQKSYELVGDHMGSIQEYVDSLSSAWPPEKSKASADYMGHLNQMITNMSTTFDAAVTNHDALASATLSISLAQPKIADIYTQYQKNEVALTAYNAKVTAFNNQKPPASSSGKSVNEFPVKSPGQSPVAADAQENLRLQAAGIMNSVSTDLAQAQLQITKPTLYVPPEIDAGKSKTEPPPLSPFVSAYDGGGSVSSGSSRPSASFPTGVGAGTKTTVISAPSLGGHTISPGTPQPGVVLGGASPTPAPAGVLPSGTATMPVGGTGPIGGTSFVTPTTPFVSSAGGNLPGAGLYPGATESTGRSGLFGGGETYQGSGNVLPPGGMLNEPSTAGSGLGMLRDSGASSLRRVNPVGGMIGEEEGVGRMPIGGSGMNSFGAPMAGGRSGAAGSRSLGSNERLSSDASRTAGGTRGSAMENEPFGSAGGRRAGKRGEIEDMPWDPDNPWATAEGVDPVVLPAKERRIDPGPAIGLR